MLQDDEIAKLTEAVEHELHGASARPHEVLKRYAEGVVYNLVRQIQADRPAILAKLEEERRAFVEECRTGKRPKYSFLPTTQELFAKRLWDSWAADPLHLPKDLGVKIEVWEGYCFLARSQWFVVSTDPERVMEPFWDYIVDPLPSGILTFDSAGKASTVGIIVIAPQSSWAKNYAGMPENLMREQEAATAAAE